MKFALKPGITWKQFAKGVLISPDIALNGSAAGMFTLIAQGKSRDEIVTEFLSQYKVDIAVIEEDWTKLTDALQSYEVIEKVS